MAHPPAAVRRALAVAALAVVGACDARACLAGTDAFPGLRTDLIRECCTCLAHRGTAFPGASCGEASLNPDGGIIIADVDGGGPLESPDFTADDGNDTIDPGEIPCVCNRDDAHLCANKLAAGDTILVTGACISQGAGLLDHAPCETECHGVVAFEALPHAP